jgi:hypothetical protein
MLQQHYDSKLSKALAHLFPDIGVEEAHFRGISLFFLEIIVTHIQIHKQRKY